jgi:uncharacterized protein
MTISRFLTGARAAGSPSAVRGWLHRYGPWAVVTGASDGIGRAFAEDLARRGIDLVLVARRAAVLEEIGTALAGRYGVRVRTVALDLSQPRAHLDLACACQDLDIGLLVAAAGYGSSGPLVAQDPVDELRMVDLNCRAVLAQCMHFGERFASRGRGGLVLMSSIVAFQGTPNAANYAATKAYIQALAEGIAPELKHSGVDVLACAPGPVHSGFAGTARMHMARADLPETVARGALDALGRAVTVRPGRLSRLLGWSLMTAPRSLRSAIMGRIMNRMSDANGVRRS